MRERREGAKREHAVLVGQEHGGENEMKRGKKRERERMCVAT